MLKKHQSLCDYLSLQNKQQTIYLDSKTKSTIINNMCFKTFKNTQWIETSFNNNIIIFDIRFNWFSKYTISSPWVYLNNGQFKLNNEENKTKSITTLKNIFKDASHISIQPFDPSEDTVLLSLLEKDIYDANFDNNSILIEQISSTLGYCPQNVCVSIVVNSIKQLTTIETME